jgi:hypothetical protein
MRKRGLKDEIAIPAINFCSFITEVFQKDIDGVVRDELALILSKVVMQGGNVVNLLPTVIETAYISGALDYQEKLKKLGYDINKIQQEFRDLKG